jgi:hypothetical protein
VREPRRCPQCGYIKWGICSPCFPREAEWERQQELAEDLAAEEDRRRRDAGMLMCPDHGVHDGCYRMRTAAEVRAELQPAPERRMSWQEAMSELRRRYASP